jgi:hypothetical protein
MRVGCLPLVSQNPILSTAGTMRLCNQSRRLMHRRKEIDWALSNMTPKAVPAAPLGLLARLVSRSTASLDGSRGVWFHISFG